MPSLLSVDDRFGTRLTVLEGGSGDFTGSVTEPDQGAVPAYQFNLPRRLLRVSPTLPVRAGMVVKSEGGSVWMVGQHGAAETSSGPIYRNFRLFEAAGQFSWQRRGKVIDPVTRLEKDTGLVDRPNIWGAYEPGNQEAFDRQIRSSIETGRFITNANIQRDDVVDGRKVTRVDLQLGLRLCSLG